MISRQKWAGASLTMLAILLAGLTGNGCTTKNIYVEFHHPPLTPAFANQSPKVLVKPFIDQRANPEQIGQLKHMGSTINWLPLPDVKVEEVLTLSVIDALKASGYNAELMKNPEAVSPGSVIVDGEVKKFLMTQGFSGGRCTIQVQLRVQSPTTHQIAHQKLLVGEDHSAMWLGLAAEYSGIAMRAIRRFQTCAMADFATKDFQGAAR